jgi:hypothetical protein
MADLAQKRNLIAFLLIISILGLFFLIAGFLLLEARQDARDAKRVADITRIRTGLEMFFYDCSIYPSKLETGDRIDGTTCGGQTYLAYVPADPKEAYRYIYTPCNSNGCQAGIAEPTGYTIDYYLENNFGNILKGWQKATPFQLY